MPGELPEVEAAMQGDFSKMADSYDDLSMDHNKKVCEWIQTQDLYGICSVLDYGCGTGNLAGFISRKGGCGVDAVDASPEMIAKVKAKYPAVNAFVCDGDGNSDQYKQTYDLVITSMVLHHVPDPPKVLKMLSNKAAQRFCLIEFEDDIGPHAKTLESMGWHLAACGKAEFDMKPEFYKLQEQANIEGVVEHEDMPEYHRASGGGTEESGDGPFKVRMNWYCKET